MHQKRIIIIGATSGIGREMALLYAAQGNIIGVTGRHENLSNELQEKFPQPIFTSYFDVMGNNNQ